MTLGEFRIIEEILHVYPDICIEAQIRRSWLFNKALNHEPSATHVQGGSGLSAAEMYAENNDTILAEYDKIITRIDGAVLKLRAEEQWIVREFYFNNNRDEFEWGNACLYQKRKKICKKIADNVLGVWESVHRYQERKAESRRATYQK